MPLSVPSNPSIALAVLVAVQATIVPGTQLAAGSSDGTGLTQVYLNDKSALSRGSFPAVNIASGKEISKHQSRSTYVGTLEVVISYYDRWDARIVTLDGVYQSISSDMLRMYSNLEDNDTLLYQNSETVQTISSYTLSKYYEDEIDHTTVPAYVLVRRTLTIQCVIPPYDV